MPAVASYKGYCWSQKRFLSEGEYIDAAIDERLQRKTYVLKVFREKKSVSKSVPFTSYKNRADFRQANPDCCKIVPHNIGDQLYISVSERLCGAAATVVELKFTVPYTDDDGSLRIAGANELYAVTNCGRAWNSRH